MPVDKHEWTSLLNQTQELVQQDFHGYPAVQRDLQGLLQSAQSARARTSRVRSLADQAAATRLLAGQGFDVSRLDQDVSMLELQPTVEDVFPADTSSVEDYLQQIQEMTILTAIQEAQQDSITSFERYMSEDMARDWAADKGRLFGALAPSAAGAGATGALSFGALPKRDTAGALTSFPGSARVGPKEAAYIAATKKLNAAAARNERLNAVAEYGTACAQTEDKGAAETSMSSCWALLADVVGAAEGRGLWPADGAAYVDALVQGARSHLAKGFASHMRTTISRHRLQAQRGGDPDQLRDVQAYLAVKFRDKGALDFQQVGGQDTSWVQVYYCLRCGLNDMALRAADKAALPRATGASGTLRPLLEAWLHDKAAFRAAHGGAMLRECERLIQGYNSSKSQVRTDFMILIFALLAGDARTIDALSQASQSLFATIEDFMWVKLSLVTAAPGAAAGGRGDSLGSPSASGAAAAVYTVPALQEDINKWKFDYYSRDGREPLLYLTVLLLTCQFAAALKLLAVHDSTKAYRVDGVHLAAALVFMEVLSAKTDATADAPNPADILHSYGRKFVASDSETALHYFMLAAQAAGGGTEVKGRLFRELLVESKDYGTLLGAGGAMGSSGAIQQFVRSPEDRRRLFEAVAYECQLSGQPEEARELFMAAERPRPALQIVIKQLSSAIHATNGALTGQVQDLISRGQAAVEAIIRVPDDGSRRDAEAFQQLLLIRQLMEASAGGNDQQAVQLVSKLTFIPTERERIDVCKAEARALDDAVRERLSDVLQCYTGSLVRLRYAADSRMLALLVARVDVLKVFVLDLDPGITSDVYARVTDCVRAFS